MNIWLRTAFLSLLAVVSLLLSSCGPHIGQKPMPSVPDLIIYTCQEKSVSEPMIKEFEERTGLLVQAEYGSSNELRKLLSEPEQVPQWDLVFGAGTETLEQTKEHWQPYKSGNIPWISQSFQSIDYMWTGFSALPLVIMYNTNVVTYRELPTGWKSLLEPRWKGRVAFGSPIASDLYASALATAVHTCSDRKEYVEQFMENINYSTLPSLSEVNSGICDGQYSLGVTLEESAQALLSSGADIDYIYPEEGTTALPDGSAIVKDCIHLDAARQFVDFTISKDAQQILATRLNRRSVRTDVAPRKGLSSIHGLPLVDFDLKDLNAEKEAVLSRWNTILHNEERKISR